EPAAAMRPYIFSRSFSRLGVNLILIALRVNGLDHNTVVTLRPLNGNILVDNIFQYFIGWTLQWVTKTATTCRRSGKCVAGLNLYLGECGAQVAFSTRTLVEPYTMRNGWQAPFNAPSHGATPITAITHDCLADFGEQTSFLNAAAATKPARASGVNADFMPTR